MAKFVNIISTYNAVESYFPIWSDFLFSFAQRVTRKLISTAGMASILEHRSFSIYAWYQMASTVRPQHQQLWTISSKELFQ